MVFWKQSLKQNIRDSLKSDSRKIQSRSGEVGPERLSKDLVSSRTSCRITSAQSSRSSGVRVTPQSCPAHGMGCKPLSHLLFSVVSSKAGSSSSSAVFQQTDAGDGVGSECTWGGGCIKMTRNCRGPGRSTDSICYPHTLSFPLQNIKKGHF